MLTKRLATIITLAVQAGCQPEPTTASNVDLIDDLASVPITTSEQPGYDRDLFQYAETGTCNVRELARQRDLDDIETIDGCRVATGPYPRSLHWGHHRLPAFGESCRAGRSYSADELRLAQPSRSCSRGRVR